jgi:hypothetical protein
MKSVLPPDLEAKRVQIAKTHNRLVLFLLAGLFLVLFLLIGIAPKRDQHGWTLLLGGIVILLILEGYGLYRILMYDQEMCAQLNFMCPHCHRPLYEPRGFINVTGRCPKCKQRIIP